MSPESASADSEALRGIHSIDAGICSARGPRVQKAFTSLTTARSTGNWRSSRWRFAKVAVAMLMGQALYVPE